MPALSRGKFAIDSTGSWKIFTALLLGSWMPSSDTGTTSPAVWKWRPLVHTGPGSSSACTDVVHSENSTPAAAQQASTHRPQTNRPVPLIMLTPFGNLSAQGGEATQLWRVLKTNNTKITAESRR